jgi:hypothetical protein
MADTNHGHSAPPVQDDAVHFGGIGWFVVVLVGTTLFCQIFVWGLFRVMAWNVTRHEPARAPLAAQAGKPSIDKETGHVLTGSSTEPAIPLNVTEPRALHEFRAGEDAKLEHYQWIDKNAQTVELPIERAKALLLERGLPVRAAQSTTAAADKPAEGAKR